LALLAAPARATDEAAAIDVGLEAVLDAVVTGGRQACSLPVAVTADPALAIAVDGAGVAISAGKAVGPTAVAITLRAVLDLIETGRLLALLVELVTDRAQAVRTQLTRGPVGASATVSSAVDTGLITVQSAVVTVLASSALPVLACAAAALIITLAGGPGSAPRTASTGPAVDTDLVAVLSSVVTRGRNTDRSIGAELTAITRAIGVVETRETVGAEVAVGPTTVDVGLSAVLVPVVTAWGSAATVGVADLLSTIAVHITRAAVGARGAAPTAVDVGLIAVLDRVITGRPFGADTPL